MAKKSNSDEYTLVDEKDFHSVEAYKALRTNLEYSIMGDDCKAIIITSSVPKEGKTSIVANLGVYLTHVGKKVLLIDCDLRNPKLHRFFKMPNHIGVTNVIMKKYTLDGAVKKINDFLSILCSGPIPPNPAELLNSKDMHEIIKDVSKEYDYVLIDTPPASQLTDAIVLSPNTNGVLLVIKHASTHVEVIKQTIDNFKKVNATIIGTVISQITTKKLRGYYKYAYYEYYESETPGKPRHKPRHKKRKYNF